MQIDAAARAQASSFGAGSGDDAADTFTPVFDGQLYFPDPAAHLASLISNTHQGFGPKRGGPSVKAIGRSEARPGEAQAEAQGEAVKGPSVRVWASEGPADDGALDDDIDDDTVVLRVRDPEPATTKYKE